MILRRRQAAMTMAHGMGSRRCRTILQRRQVAIAMAHVMGAGGAAPHSTGDKWPQQWLMLLVWEVLQCGLRDTDRRLHMGLEVE